jgi:hypothetical protein
MKNFQILIENFISDLIYETNENFDADFELDIYQNKIIIIRAPKYFEKEFTENNEVDEDNRRELIIARVGKSFQNAVFEIICKDGNTYVSTIKTRGIK